MSASAAHPKPKAEAKLDEKAIQAETDKLKAEIEANINNAYAECKARISRIEETTGFRRRTGEGMYDDERRRSAFERMLSQIWDFRSFQEGRETQELKPFGIAKVADSAALQAIKEDVVAFNVSLANLHRFIDYHAMLAGLPKRQQFADCFEQRRKIGEKYAHTEDEKLAKLESQHQVLEDFKQQYLHEAWFEDYAATAAKPGSADGLTGVQLAVKLYGWNYKKNEGDIEHDLKRDIQKQSEYMQAMARAQIYEDKTSPFGKLHLTVKSLQKHLLDARVKLIDEMKSIYLRDKSKKEADFLEYLKHGAGETIYQPKWSSKTDQEKFKLFHEKFKIVESLLSFASSKIKESSNRFHFENLLEVIVRFNVDFNSPPRQPRKYDSDDEEDERMLSHYEFLSHQSGVMGDAGSDLVKSVKSTLAALREQKLDFKKITIEELEKEAKAIVAKETVQLVDAEVDNKSAASSSQPTARSAVTVAEKNARLQRVTKEMRYDAEVMLHTEEAKKALAELKVQLAVMAANVNKELKAMSADHGGAVKQNTPVQQAPEQKTDEQKAGEQKTAEQKIQNQARVVRDLQNDFLKVKFSSEIFARLPVVDEKGEIKKSIEQYKREFDALAKLAIGFTEKELEEQSKNAVILVEQMIRSVKPSDDPIKIFESQREAYIKAEEKIREDMARWSKAHEEIAPHTLDEAMHILCYRIQNFVREHSHPYHPVIFKSAINHLDLTISKLKHAKLLEQKEATPYGELAKIQREINRAIEKQKVSLKNEIVALYSKGAADAKKKEALMLDYGNKLERFSLSMLSDDMTQRSSDMHTLKDLKAMPKNDDRETVMQLGKAVKRYVALTEMQKLLLIDDEHLLQIQSMQQCFKSLRDFLDGGVYSGYYGGSIYYGADFGVDEAKAGANEANAKQPTIADLFASSGYRPGFFDPTGVGIIQTIREHLAKAEQFAPSEFTAFRMNLGDGPE